MTLRIRQIVLAASDLAATVAQLESELGLQVAYRDPLVASFGLHNALLPIGDQFLEVVSPLHSDTAVARHLKRHGDSSYMLILQTDELSGDRRRIERLGVRVIWEASYPDISAMHLHPKDIGAAIVSLDQPVPAQSWRWAGPDWRAPAAHERVREVTEVTIGAVDPLALSKRWSDVLGTEAASDSRLAIERGTLCFAQASADLIVGYRLALHASSASREVTICGSVFQID